MPLQKTTVAGSSIQTLNLPLPSPVPVALTFATHKGMLLIGSTQQVVTDAITAYTKKNGLVTDRSLCPRVVASAWRHQKEKIRLGSTTA